VSTEPEDSWPCAQEPATGPYHELTESTLHPQPIQPISLTSILIHILSSTPRSSEWSLSFRLSHQNLVQFSLLSHVCYMPCSPHFPWFNLPNDIWGWVKIMKLIIVQFLFFSLWFFFFVYWTVYDIFYHGSCVSSAQSQRCRVTTHCRLSTTAYSVYSQLSSIRGGRLFMLNLTKRHAVVTYRFPCSLCKVNVLWNT
jgi:hypothetical protein